MRTGGSATSTTGDMDVFTASSTSGKENDIDTLLSLFTFSSCQNVCLTSLQVAADTFSSAPAPAFCLPDKLPSQAVLQLVVPLGQVRLSIISISLVFAFENVFMRHG